MECNSITINSAVSSYLFIFCAAAEQGGYSTHTWPGFDFVDDLCKTICTSIYLSGVSLLASAFVRLLGPDPTKGRSVWLRHNHSRCVKGCKSSLCMLESPLVVGPIAALMCDFMLGQAPGLFLFSHSPLCQQPVYPLLTHYTHQH